VGTDDYGTRRLVSKMPVGSQLSLATSRPRLLDVRTVNSRTAPPRGSLSAFVADHHALVLLPLDLEEFSCLDEVAQLPVAVVA